MRTLQQRDRRALFLLAGTAAVVLLLRFALPEETQPRIVAPSDSITTAEKRLARLRLRAAALASREKALREISAELASREKGMIEADTPPRAQAQLLQVLRRVASAEAPPVEFKTVEMGQVRPLDESYREIAVPVVFECRIEQLVNLVAGLGAQPEILATSDVRVSIGDVKQKTIQVRMTVSAVGPRRLAPERKGPHSL